ncbi:MAG: DUF6783 domain-containing protein [Lachnospiraceae bacterium]
MRIKSPTNWDSQLTKSLFQTRSRESNSRLDRKQRVHEHRQERDADRRVFI